MSLLFLLGCGGGSSAGDGVDESSASSPGDNTINSPANSPTSEVVNSADSSIALLTELQGDWVANTCTVEQNQSLSESVSFHENIMTRTLVRHTASTDCSDKLTISRSFVADVDISGETSLTEAGTANHILVAYTRGFITASSESDAQLESQGTTLQDMYAAQGIADIDNIPLDDFVDWEVVYSIYQIDGDLLRLGSESNSVNGSSPAQRLDTFDDTVFTRAENNVDVDSGTVPPPNQEEIISVSGPGCVAAGSANQTVSVLLIGNSLMNDVQSNLELLLACGGYTSDMATSNPGGSWLHEHNENLRTNNLIAEGYNLTLVQEQSRGISTHTPPYEIINALKEKIEAAGSEMGFYQTWGYQNRDPALTHEILSTYEFLAEEFNAPIMHIGRAWDEFYTSYNDSPPFSLYLDYAHATKYGKALIAYVLYAYLTGESPVNLYSLLLTHDEALELQNLAWSTYQSNL